MRRAATGLVLAAFLTSVATNPTPNVWPRPAETKWNGPHDARAVIDADTFRIAHDLPPSVAMQALDTAIDLHMQLFPRKLPYVPYDGWMKQDENHIESIKGGDPAALPRLTELRVVVEYPDVPLQLAERGSEAYTLTIKRTDAGAAEAELTAFTVWGALYGLWTFQQLATAHEADDGSVLAVPFLTIDDWPRFTWRGFLVDTSRHFLSIGTLKRVVDTLAMNRLNVLHWHLVDSHSFPLEISAIPDLARKGAWGSFYSDSTRASGSMPKFTYGSDDVIELVRYAALRGVRVMPEMDTPAHVTAWGKALPDFIACPDLHFAAHALDPRHEKNFETVQTVLREVGDLFPDLFFHLGADELNMDCWGYKEATRTKGKAVKEYATKRGVSLDKLLQEWLERVVPLAEQMGKEPVLYADPYLRGVKIPPSSILQVWGIHGAVDMIKKIAGSGHRTIFSAGYYLDMQKPALDQKQERYNYEDTWRDIYNCDPVTDAKLTPLEESRVLGGEVCMWGEAVDATNLFTKSFPRASAAAERFWSMPGCGNQCRDGDEVLIRLMRFRCLMVLVGVKAGPLAPDYCPYVYQPSVLGDPDAPPAPTPALDRPPAGDADPSRPASTGGAHPHTYAGEQAARAVDKVEEALGIADGEERHPAALLAVVSVPMVAMLLLVARSRRMGAAAAQKAQ